MSLLNILILAGGIFTVIQGFRVLRSRKIWIKWGSRLYGGEFQLVGKYAMWWGWAYLAAGVMAMVLAIISIEIVSKLVILFLVTWLGGMILYSLTHDK